MMILILPSFIGKGVEDIPQGEGIMKIRKECNKKLLCQMLVPIKIFTEPTDSVRVRDVDISYEKALYRQFLMNPQNHLHRNPFNILLNKQWKTLPDDEEKEGGNDR